MKRMKNTLLIVCGALLAAGGFWFIRLLPDSQGPLQALPFLCIWGIDAGLCPDGCRPDHHFAIRGCLSVYPVLRRVCPPEARQRTMTNAPASMACRGILFIYFVTA